MTVSSFKRVFLESRSFLILRKNLRYCTLALKLVPMLDRGVYGAGTPLDFGIWCER
jgi:hypothetical protein